MASVGGNANLHLFCLYFFREELYRQFYVHRMRMGDPTAMLAPQEVFRNDEEAERVRDKCYDMAVVLSDSSFRSKYFCLTGLFG